MLYCIPQHKLLWMGEKYEETLDRRWNFSGINTLIKKITARSSTLSMFVFQYVDVGHYCHCCYSLLLVHSVHRNCILSQKKRISSKHYALLGVHKLTQAGIATKGLLSAWRFRRRTTIVTTTARPHRETPNKKYITANICHICHIFVICINE